MHFYINYISKDFYSIYLLVFLISIFIFKIFNSTKLIYLFNRFKYSMTNLFPGISEEEKGLSKSNYFNLFNSYWFLFITSIITFVIDSFINFKNPYDLFKIWLIIAIICISRYLLVRFIFNTYIDYNLNFLSNKIYNLSIHIAFFAFIIVLINSYFFSYNSFFLKTLISICLIIYMAAQLSNYLYFIRSVNLKLIVYFILYLCAFKLAPWIWLYSNILKVSI
jgi:hypothetical protein